MTVTTPACVERPVWFAGDGQELFGMLTAAREGTSFPAGVILLTGGAYIAGVNRNRLSVVLARRLAAAGLPTLRFDYHGVGESLGEVTGFNLDKPFTQDLLAAVRWFRNAGIERFVLVGSCFGARTILAASEQIDGLIGTALVSTPVRDFAMGDRLPSRYAVHANFFALARKALRPYVLRNIVAPSTRESGMRSRHVYARTFSLKLQTTLGRLTGRNGHREGANTKGASKAFLRGFAGLLKRRVPVLLLYGTEEEFYAEFEQVRLEHFSGLRTAVPDVEVRTIDGVLHGFTTLRVQEAALDHIETWIRRVVSPEVSQDSASADHA